MDKEHTHTVKHFDDISQPLAGSIHSTLARLLCQGPCDTTITAVTVEVESNDGQTSLALAPANLTPPINPTAWNWTFPAGWSNQEASKSAGNFLRVTVSFYEGADILTTFKTVKIYTQL